MGRVHTRQPKECSTARSCAQLQLRIESAWRGATATAPRGELAGSMRPLNTETPASAGPVLKIRAVSDRSGSSLCQLDPEARPKCLVPGFPCSSKTRFHLGFAGASSCWLECSCPCCSSRSVGRNVRDFAGAVDRLAPDVPFDSVC